MGPHGNEFLTRLLESGRLYLMASTHEGRHPVPEPVLLKRGEVRGAHLDWGADESGRMVPRIIRSGAAVDVSAVAGSHLVYRCGRR